MYYKKIWNSHWKNKKMQFFLDKISRIYRINLLGKLGGRHANKFFKNGIFIECGSGTGEASSRIKRNGKKLVAIDINPTPLFISKTKHTHDYYILADIVSLPIKNNCIDGVWNFGVMEHFKLCEIKKTFFEFYRILKSNGICIIFWPSLFNIIYISFRAFYIFSLLFKLQIRGVIPHRGFYLITAKVSKKIWGLINKIGYSKIYIHQPSLQDLYCHYKVICKK